jgi:PAS domain S-box-containing protein
LWDESGKLEAVAMTEPEITVKEQTEAALLKAHDNLEKGVRTRTAELQQANEEVLIEKEFLRITLECIGDAVITTDVAGKITYLNPVAEQLTGWDNVEATGLPLLDVFKILGESTRQPAERPLERYFVDTPRWARIVHRRHGRPNSFSHGGDTRRGAHFSRCHQEARGDKAARLPGCP